MPDWLFDNELTPWVPRLGRVLFILLVAFVSARILRRVIRRVRSSSLRVMLRHADGSVVELEKRAQTIGGIIQKAAAGLLWSVAIVMALREIGFDVTPILAGAGVVGLAVGFGAQNLVRDVISGLFMLLENQIRVGDVVMINGTGGLVEEINLRTTVLRSPDGAVHIFPNGTITALSNLTREFSYYVFDIGVGYSEDTDRVSRVLIGTAEELRQDPAFTDLILEPLEVQGVDRFADSSVVIRARIKTQPTKQWAVGREMNRRIKKAFEEHRIEIPFPQRTIHVRAGSPLPGQTAGAESGRPPDPSSPTPG